MKHYLIVNSGSTSLKFGIYEDATPLKLCITGMIESMSSIPSLKIYDNKEQCVHTKVWDSLITHTDGLQYVIDFLGKMYPNLNLVCAGHRVVLGGERYEHPTIINENVLNYLDSLSIFVPSHQPFNLAGIKAIQKIYPSLPQVAVFDSSFHQSMLDTAKIYPLDKSLRDTGVRHWGFHGISYDYITHRMEELNILDSKVIVAHLGGGASITAIKDGKCLDTSMQFSGLTGLPMATRSGDIPVDVALYLLKQKIVNVDELEKSLYKKSGLFGLSGNSDDMRVIQNCSNTNDKIAFDYFIYALTKFVGSYTSLLQGMDSLVFTAGIGENSHQVRTALCNNLKWIGVEIDEDSNIKNEILISSKNSKVKVYVIPTDEEIMIANYSKSLLN